MPGRETPFMRSADERMGRILHAIHDAAMSGGVVTSALHTVDRLRTRSLPGAARVEAPDARSQPRRIPSVSVIVPLYNYGRFLPVCVASALDQSHVEVEVIIVDDASTDNSLQIATDIAAADPRVTLLANGTNRGHVVTFNNGLNEARGELVVRLDADDLLTPGSLARSAALFEAFPAVGLVYGRPRHFHGAPPQAQGRLSSWTVWPGRVWLAERCRVGVNCITTPEAVLRRSVIDEVGGLRTELRFAQDMEMWLRAASVADVGHVDGVDQALHREHEASMSMTDGSGAITDLLERRRVFDVLFDGARMAVDGRNSLAEAARKSIADGLRRHIEHEMDRGALEPGADFPPELASAWARISPGSGVRMPQPVGRVHGATRRAGRRLGDEVRYLHWARTGL